MRRVYYPFNVLHSTNYSMRIFTAAGGWIAGNGSSPEVDDSVGPSVITRRAGQRRRCLPALLVTPIQLS